MKKLEKLSSADWQELYLQHARGERHDVVPFPSDDIQVITNNQKAEVTGKGAISIYGCIMACANDALSLNDNTRVLDYGCGWGRMTRLMCNDFALENIVGVDVDQRLISSANELLPEMDHQLIKSMKPLPFDDGSFDIVFANSVFSHLSEKSCVYTLSELARILAKGGVLIISVLEENEMNKFYSNDAQTKWITDILGKQEKALETLHKNGFVWGDTGRWHQYGIAIMNNNWISDRFADNGLTYQGTKTGKHMGTHNYKYGVKR